MIDQTVAVTAAEEHLRVIRSLMEKATIYRAVSAPVALVGGIASLVQGVSLWLAWRPLMTGIARSQFGLYFILGWLVVLAITFAAGCLFLSKDARQRAEPFLSPGMRKALSAMFPPFFCGVFLTLCLLPLKDVSLCLLPVVWMLFYGLALLATGTFAPRSIVRLGWLFIMGGMASMGLYWRLAVSAFWNNGADHFPTAANLLMTATFGGFHLLYAFCTWPRKTPAIPAETSDV